jgi:hypothetical protein
VKATTGETGKNMTRKMIEVNWLWLGMALVLALIVVTLFTPKPVASA